MNPSLLLSRTPIRAPYSINSMLHDEWQGEILHSSSMALAAPQVLHARQISTVRLQSIRSPVGLVKS
ncbi:hypothetical protein [Sphingopyxis sp. PAMC25046]|uniref:hypothetical protein n=1 Tax=Sphingopyxis sp. PAMC25046 TaxID=2565556 RepID=UPI0014482FFB|nr:hypothetical protein [Sphingopyxis sp. PAMC25046]